MNDCLPDLFLLQRSLLAVCRFVFASTFAVEALLRNDGPVAEFRDKEGGREGGFGLKMDNCLFKQCTKVCVEQSHGCLKMQRWESSPRA